MSLGCGNPPLLAKLEPGQKVLDLGSGAGLDLLLSARRVDPGGHAYGLDMTDEMLAVANANKARAEVANTTFLKGTIDNIPLPADSVDVVISNCVINLAEDKRAVLAEAYRVLLPGGRLAVSDMVEVDVGFQTVDIEVSHEYAPPPFEGKIASAAVRAIKPIRPA